MVRNLRSFVTLAALLIASLIASACSAGSGDDSPTASLPERTVVPAPTFIHTPLPTLPPSPAPLAELGSAPLTSIDGAEAEARDWPVIDAPEDETASAGRYAGVADRVCVEVQPGVSGNGAWRSGDFVTGSWDVYLKERPADQRYSKIWWSPVYNRPDLLAGVTVRAVRLDVSRADSLMEVFYFDQVAWPSPPDQTPTPLPEGGHPDYFYPSGLELPTGGRWMLVATMGPNWGCFVIHLAPG